MRLLQFEGAIYSHAEIYLNTTTLISHLITPAYIFVTFEIIFCNLSLVYRTFVWSCVKYF
jgi:hypothetical protein